MRTGDRSTSLRRIASWRGSGTGLSFQEDRAMPIPNFRSLMLPLLRRLAVVRSTSCAILSTNWLKNFRPPMQNAGNLCRAARCLSSTA